MLWRQLLYIAAAIVSFVYAHDDPSADGAVLKPIHIRDWEAAHAVGLERRESEIFADLDPQAQSQLIYGRSGTDGQLTFANMTLYAEDGRQIVMMERFETLTKAVDCKGDDGTMSLTFRSKAAFDYACNTWKYINQTPDTRFLLIANHDGCGPDDERAPYLISSIREDVSSLTTFLSAEISEWSKVAGTYDLDFGHATLAKPSSQRARRRGLFRDIGNAISNGVNNAVDGIRQTGSDIVEGVKDVGDGIADTFERVGTIDLSKTVTIPVNVGTPGKVTNIINEDGLAAVHAKIDCVNCFVAGSFAITGRVSVKLFDMADFVLTAAPQDFAAALEMAADITGFTRPDSLKRDMDLFNAPIPDAGIVVPGILDLGLTVKYRLTIGTTFSSGAQFNFGLRATIPNGALITADFKHSDQSRATGWDGAKLDPSFDFKALDAAVRVAAAAQPMLVFGIDVKHVAKFNVELNLKLPQVQANLTGIYNETGACPGDSSKTGVSLQSDVDIELQLQIKTGTGDDEHLLYTKPLVVFWKLPLLFKCWPFNIPGLGPATTTVPPAPSLAPLNATSLPETSATTSSRSSVGIATTVTPSQVASISSFISSPTSVLTAISTSLSIAPTASIEASNGIPPTTISNVTSPSSTSAPPSTSSAGVDINGTMPMTSSAVALVSSITQSTISHSNSTVLNRTAPPFVPSNTHRFYPTGSSAKAMLGSLGTVLTSWKSDISPPCPLKSAGRTKLSCSTGMLPPYPTVTNVSSMYMESPHRDLPGSSSMTSFTDMVSSIRPTLHPTKTPCSGATLNIPASSFS